MAKKRLSSEVFYWDAPRRRLHKRDLFPLQMEINGTTYFVSQWTLKYFKVIDYSDKIKLHQAFSIRPIVKFRDFNIQFDATAIPLHYDAKKQELVASFKNIPEEHKELLSYFSEALNSGDMVSIDNVLRRVDMPVTPASTELTKTPAKVLQSQKIKRNLYTGLYLVVGFALVLFTFITVYHSLFHLNIETAFVYSPITPIQAHTQGTVKKILVHKNEQISIGQPLLRLDVSSSDRLPKQYKIDAAKQQVFLYQTLINDKINKAGKKADLGKTKLNAANASLQAALLKRTIKCNRHYASEIDRRNPKKRSAECQVSRKQVTAARAKVKSSKSYLATFPKNKKNTTKQANTPIQKSLAILQAKLELAQQKLKVIQATPESLAGIETIYSPVAGKLIKIIQSENQYMKKGQLIAVIEKSGSQQFIQAHLSHEEAAKLKVGSKAIAYSPALPRDYPMVVEHVDFSDDIISMGDIDLFNKYIPENKPIKITLKFIDKNAETLTFALPVQLSIEKYNPFTEKVKQTIAGILDFFISKTQAENLSIKQENAAYCFAYTPNPMDCKSATHLFPQNFIKHILPEKNSKNIKEESKKNLLKINWQKRLLKKAKRLLKHPPSPVKKLQSAGITNAKNKSLKKTRTALRDAHNTALLALSYYLSKDDAYLKQAKKYLLAWAETLQPNGHPINETRLEGFLWAYDLLFCEFDPDERKIMTNWLTEIQAKKHQWKFGPSSTKNNFRTHQLKILLMLDRLLGDEKSLNTDKENLRQHINNNLLEKGISIDYEERDALHYHVYNLEPWLEIALLEPTYQEKVKESYQFLIQQIKDGKIHNQFSNSKQKIDAKRAKGGFSYAKKGSTFDSKRITRSIIAFNTLLQQTPEKDVTDYLSKKKIKQSLLFHYIRYFLWETPCLIDCDADQASSKNHLPPVLK